MTYSAPELLLVGAAQNLVLLDGSTFEGKETAFCRDQYPLDIDASSGEYNTVPTW